VKNGIDFLGFKIFPTHRVLLKSNLHRIKRRLRFFQKKYRAGQISLEDIQRSLSSWAGHAKWGDTYQLRHSLLLSHAFVRE